MRVWRLFIAVFLAVCIPAISTVPAAAVGTATFSMGIGTSVGDPFQAMDRIGFRVYTSSFLTPEPTGSADVFVDNALVRSSTITELRNGFDVQGIRAGVHTISVRYAGDSYYAPAVATQTDQWHLRTPVRFTNCDGYSSRCFALSTGQSPWPGSSEPSVHVRSAGDTYLSSPLPSGHVDYTNADGTVRGRLALDANGNAASPLRNFVGQTCLTFSYDGDGVFAPSPDTETICFQGQETILGPTLLPKETPRAYRLISRDGRVFNVNVAPLGSLEGVRLNRPIVGATNTATEAGYWMVASDGGIFSFGDARFYGSMGGKPLNQPIVGMAATPTGNGYWLVASDGGIFSFGNASFAGSMVWPSSRLPIPNSVGIVTSRSGSGYYVVDMVGGVRAFDVYSVYGSGWSNPIYQPIVALVL